MHGLNVNRNRKLSGHLYGLWWHLSTQFALLLYAVVVAEGYNPNCRHVITSHTKANILVPIS